MASEGKSEAGALPAGAPVAPTAPPLEETLATLVPDAADTLGGTKEDHEPEHPSVLRHLLSQLRPGQDLTRVLIPSFFLEPRSLLEKMADVMMHPQLALPIPTLTDPYERMVGLVRWFLSGFHFKTLGVKKPFNPIIGETFACCWKHDDGSHSQYFAEQVSHRPPVTALYFENRRHHIVFNAQVWTQSKFTMTGSAKSVLVGGASVHLTNIDEEYYVTFPTYYCHGLLGTLRMEVGDHADIVCAKTGMAAHIDFQMKPMFRGADKINSIKGTIKHDGKLLANLEGHWDKQLFITKTGGAKEVLLDVSATPVMPKYVLPVEQQGPWESRRLWRRCAEELNKRPVVEWDNVDREKTRLEEEQRKLACHQKVPGPWHTKKFHQKPYKNPITGEDENIFTFDYMRTTPYDPYEPSLNLVWMSKFLPDDRPAEAGGVPTPTPGAPAPAPAGGAGAGAGGAEGSA